MHRGKWTCHLSQSLEFVTKLGTQLAWKPFPLFPPRSFIGPILSVLKALLPSPLRDQLEVCRNVTELEKFIDINEIPTEYGGNSSYKLGESPEEKSLAALIEKNASSPY